MEADQELKNELVMVLRQQDAIIPTPSINTYHVGKEGQRINAKRKVNVSWPLT